MLTGSKCHTLQDKMVKEVKHSKEAHQRSGTTKDGNTPHKDSLGDKEVENKEAAGDVGQAEKRVIARQDSHLTKSEKHRDIQDLERRMAQVTNPNDHAPCIFLCCRPQSPLPMPSLIYGNDWNAGQQDSCIAMELMGVVALSPWSGIISCQSKEAV